LAGRAVISAGFRAILQVEKLISRYSLAGDSSFLDPGAFPWIARLEDGWKEIRTELDQVLTVRDALPNFQDISVAQASLTNDDR
jgi:aspartyl/asparaginyl beta-hydroxylase (cupin superfamily)